MYGILENTQNMLSQEDDSQPYQIQGGNVLGCITATEPVVNKRMLSLPSEHSLDHAQNSTTM